MFGFTVDDLCGRSRRRPLVIARQIGMYVFRELTDFSLPQDRRGVRRPRPHDRDPRGREDQGPDDRAPQRVRPGQRADEPHPTGRAPVDKPVDSWGYLAVRGGELHRRRHLPVTALGTPVDKRRGYETASHQDRTHGYPQSTGPTTATTRTSIVFVRRWTVKFRCERDTLAEAIGTAQRAVSARSGALPGALGHPGHRGRRSHRARRLGSRSDDLGAGAGPGRHRGPGGRAGEALRRPDHPAQGRGRDLRGRGRRRPDRGGSSQGQRAAAAGRRVPADRRPGRVGGHRRRGTVRRGAAPGDPGGVA